MLILVGVGGSPGFVGQIKQVKVLGGLALNDVSWIPPGVF